MKVLVQARVSRQGNPSMMGGDPIARIGVVSLEKT
jgi:hypothetical protein